VNVVSKGRFRARFRRELTELERDDDDDARRVVEAASGGGVDICGRASDVDDPDGCGSEHACSGGLERVAVLAVESEQFNRGRARFGVFLNKCVGVSRGRLCGAAHVRQFGAGQVHNITEPAVKQGIRIHRGVYEWVGLHER